MSQPQLSGCLHPLIPATAKQRRVAVKAGIQKGLGMGQTKKAWVAAFAGMSGVVLSALLIASPHAEPEPDLERQAAMAERFTPFDSGGGPGWENAFPTPEFRLVPAGKPEAMTLTLKPGAYMIVALCNCQSMQVTLVGPDGAMIAPLRSNDQAAMYSLDVKAAGDYLTGVDMDGCAEKDCDIGVKVYRKKS